MLSMLRRVWTALGGASLLFFCFVPPAGAMFEIFTQLAEDLKKIEQSSPEGIDQTLKDIGATGTFLDVQAADWFYRYVAPVARWGIVSGYKDSARAGTFGPGNTVTVAEILKMALKAAQVDESKCKGSAGLVQDESHWAQAFVVCAHEKKMRILKTNFALDRPATRAEVLGIIFDAFADTVPPLFAPFKDAAGHPLESDIAYAAALKMVSGDKDAAGKPVGTFRPNDDVKRAEAAKIIYERLRVEVMGEKK